MVDPSNKVSVTLWLKRIASILLILVVMDALLFGAAGRLDWFGAWLLTGLYLPLSFGRGGLDQPQSPRPDGRTQPHGPKCQNVG